MVAGKMFIKTVDTRNVFNHNTKHTNRRKKMSINKEAAFYLDNGCNRKEAFRLAKIYVRNQSFGNKWLNIQKHKANKAKELWGNK